MPGGLKCGNTSPIIVDIINDSATSAMSHSTDGVAVLDLLGNLAYTLNARLRTQLEHEGVALAPMEALALSYLQANPGCSQADFVQFLGRDKAQVARIVKPLIDRALVVSIADGADRRLNRLWLTEDGKAVQRKAGRQRFLLAEQMMDGFDEKQRTRVGKLLRKMAQALDAPGATASEAAPADR